MIEIHRPDSTLLFVEIGDTVYLRSDGAVQMLGGAWLELHHFEPEADMPTRRDRVPYNMDPTPEAMVEYRRQMEETLAAGRGSSRTLGLILLAVLLVLTFALGLVIGLLL